ncbi:MAG TPA: acyltransferase [Acidobacteriota bacterium]|jgi:acetyltransferase-like isoleucine patch superfamily enzyme
MSTLRIQHDAEKMRNLGRLAMGRLRANILTLRGAVLQEKVFVGSGCRIERPWCLMLGTRCMLEDDVYIKIVDDGASVECGGYLFIGRGTQFDIQSRLVIGDNSLIAPGCFITDHQHRLDPNYRIDEQECIAKSVAIGRDVWLGTKAIVLAGVTIGNGAVVGAGSVVTRNVPPMAVVAGVPATIIRYRNELHRNAQVTRTRFGRHSDLSA